MVTDNLDVTYTMVWSIALANILGAGLCFAFSGQFAKIATLRYTLVIPAIISIMMVGAYQASADWGDLFTLLIYGVVGWTMKHLKWPRPPLILGFVLGGIVEDYMRISYQIYEWAWVLKPVCAVMLTLAALSLLQPLFTRIFIKKEKFTTNQHFLSLCREIIGQQLSVKAAKSIWERFIKGIKS